MDVKLHVVHTSTCEQRLEDRELRHSCPLVAFRQWKEGERKKQINVLLLFCQKAFAAVWHRVNSAESCLGLGLALCGPPDAAALRLAQDAPAGPRRSGWPSVHWLALGPRLALSALPTRPPSRCQREGHGSPRCLYWWAGAPTGPSRWLRAGVKQTRRADDGECPEASTATFRQGFISRHIILKPLKQNVCCLLSLSRQS